MVWSCAFQPSQLTRFCPLKTFSVQGMIHPSLRVDVSCSALEIAPDKYECLRIILLEDDNPFITLHDLAFFSQHCKKKPPKPCVSSGNDRCVLRKQFIPLTCSTELCSSASGPLFGSGRSAANAPRCPQCCG